MTRLRASRALIVALVIAGAGCTESEPSSQVLTGKVTTSGALAVRAVSGEAVVTATQVRSDGSFTLVLPAGTARYRLEVLTTSGVRHVFTRANGSLADLSFRVCAPIDPFDLGDMGPSGSSPGHPDDPPWPCMDPTDPNCGGGDTPTCNDPMDPSCQPPWPCMDPMDPNCGTGCDPMDPNTMCPPPPCQPGDPNCGGGTPPCADPMDPSCQPPPCADPTDPNCGGGCDPMDPNTMCPPPPCSNPMDPSCGMPPTPGCSDPMDPYCFCDASGVCPQPWCTDPAGNNEMCPPPPPAPCTDPMDPTTCDNPCANDPDACACPMGEMSCWPTPQPPECDASGMTCMPGAGGMTPEHPPTDFGCVEESPTMEPNAP